MAQLKDFPKVVKQTGFLGFVKKVWGEVTKDDVFTWGSALAYAWIFAIFPFLIFVLTLAPYLPGKTKENILGQVADLAWRSLGEDTAQTVYQSVEQVITQQKGGLLSIGLLLALWGASGGMVMTMNALDKAYFVTCTRSFIKQRAIAIGLTAASAVLILSVVLLLPIGSAILNFLHIGIFGKVLINVLRYGLALALLFGIVSMIYYFGPCIKQKWQAVTPGAIFTVAVWILMGLGFGFYVQNFGNFNKTYGALGGAIAMLLFFYIDAVVLLIGAEINSVIDFEVLQVKPGATDLASAVRKEEAEAAAGQQGKEGGPGAGHEGVAADDFALPARGAGPKGRPVRKAVVMATSLYALRWAWRAFWSKQAKARVRERAEAKQKRWWRLSAG